MCQENMPRARARGMLRDLSFSEIAFMVVLLVDCFVVAWLTRGGTIAAVKRSCSSVYVIVSLFKLGNSKITKGMRRVWLAISRAYLP